MTARTIRTAVGGTPYDSAAAELEGASMSGGATRSVTLTVSEPGDHRFVGTIHEQGQVGRLVVSAP